MCPAVGVCASINSFCGAFVSKTIDSFCSVVQVLLVNIPRELIVCGPRYALLMVPADGPFTVCNFTSSEKLLKQTVTSAL